MLRMGSPLTLTAWRNKTEGIGQEFKGQRAKGKLYYHVVQHKQEDILLSDCGTRGHCSCPQTLHRDQTNSNSHTGAKGLKYSRERVKLDVPVMV